MSGEFHTFEGIARLLKLLSPIVEHEAPGLLRDFGDVLGRFMPNLEHASAGRNVRQAETVIFAITRRISRESHHSAIEIHRLARYILEAHRRCPSLRSGLTVVIPDVERWDRPSLRCLHRVARLALPEDRVTVVALRAEWRGHAKVGTQDDALAVLSRLESARASFFRRLKEHADFRYVEVTLPRSDTRTEEVDVHGRRRFHDLLLEVGMALTYQNYERVHVLCARLLTRAMNAEERAEAHRLIAIADAQLGAFTDASSQLEVAIGLTREATYAAHLHYLLGLVATKRFYDLDAAGGHYQRGLAVLATHDPDEPQARVERAWLLNGVALVATMRAKEASGVDEQRDLLRRSTALEMEAYELVRGESSPAASYLRHNLLANITFLLEIGDRFETAVEFWRRAFEQYLAADSPGFELAFQSRLGFLLLKAGRSAEAIDAWEAAVQRCRDLGDPFYRERICLALGQAALERGLCGRAADAFIEGQAVAASVRDADAFWQHSLGLMHTAAASGDVPLFEAALAATSALASVRSITSAIREHAVSGDLHAALADTHADLIAPATKMSAYVPDVDLEGAPAKDLNRYLVASADDRR
ncbi:MAG: tetratricopeptide repeat protein [Acidimicrobiales bacterium]